MQMFNSPYSSCLNCLREVLKKEGLHALYRSYITQLTMNVPFHVIHIMTYEKLQQEMNSKREYNPKVHMIAGGLAGGIASAVTTPLDCIKTVINTQESSTLSYIQKNSINGLIPAFRTIKAIKGYSGFFRGMRARVLFQMPGTAISWSVYELFKNILSINNLQESTEGNDLEKDGVISLQGFHSSDDTISSIGSATNKTVERLKQLQIPSTLATASCSPMDNKLFKDTTIISQSNRI